MSKNNCSLNGWVVELYGIKMIDLNNNTYKETKKFAFYNDMSKEIIKQKNELPWLSDCPSQVLQQKCMDLSAAISNSSRTKNR